MTLWLHGWEQSNQNSTYAEASTTSHVTYVPNWCTCHILHFEKRNLMSTCFDLQGGLEHDMSSYDSMRSCWSRLVVPCFNVLQLDMICYQDRKNIYLQMSTMNVVSLWRLLVWSFWSLPLIKALSRQKVGLPWSMNSLTAKSTAGEPQSPFHKSLSCM